MELKRIVEKINPKEIINMKNTEIIGISYNSKTIKSHEIFVCLKGEHVDGHDFAQMAFEKGAAALVCEKPLNIEIPQLIVESTQSAIADLADCFYRSPSKSLNLIGVTGTNGKTSVTHLIQKIMEYNKQKCGIIGTLGYKLHSEGDYFEAKHTTPQAPELQATLDRILQNEIDNVVMEVSSHSLDQHRVKNCAFKGAVFTNLTQDHLDYHITMENYFNSKAKLFEGLADNTFAVINLDDKWGKRFLERTSKKAWVKTYAIKKTADVMAQNVEFKADGAKFTCVTGNKSLDIKLHLNGLFSIYNALAAITTALCMGVDLETIKEALEGTRGVSGRFEIVHANPMVIVDYAHTPDGLDNILRAARELVSDGGELICLFGCGGNRDATKRPKMGKIAQELSDKIIITSDNPRSEDPKQIISDIMAGLEGVNPKSVYVEIDRGDAIKLLKKISKSEDVLVVAGKGHEDYQILKDKTIHFDDREEVVKAFAE